MDLAGLTLGGTMCFPLAHSASVLSVCADPTYLMHQLRFVESEIDLLDQRLEELGQWDQSLAAAVARWTTVPGGSCRRLELGR
jgi:hypothetical protein